MNNDKYTCNWLHDFNETADVVYHINTTMHNKVQDGYDEHDININILFIKGVSEWVS